MDFEEEAAKEANILSEQQYENYLAEVEKIPSKRAPINGAVARLLFDFMEDTGLRIKETIHVRKKDLDFRTRIITVVYPKAEKQCRCSTWRYKDLHSRQRILESVDINCKICQGKGRWKKPQRTTWTPRITHRLLAYCSTIQDDALLFPIHRYTVWRWAKEAGKKAGINIFQQKDEKIIFGVFPHLFRALCSKRMIRDAKDHPYRDELLVCKRRDSVRPGFVADRYTKIDIMYLLDWEAKTYVG